MDSSFKREAGVPSAQEATPLVLVRGGEVYAPEPLGRQDLLIAVGRILLIGPHLEPPESLGPVQVIDAAGMLVTPGIIDGHVHILGGGGQGGGHTRNRDLVLSHATAAGVTTLIGCLGMDYYTRHISSLLAKARGLEAEGLSTYITTGGYGVPTPTLTGSILADLTLVDKVVGVGEIAVSDHRSSHPSHDELARIASEARVGGLYGEKAGVIIFHVGEGREGLGPLRRLADETDVPLAHFLPTHINRTRKLWEEGVAYAQRGGYIDITAGIAPARGFPAALKPSEAAAEALKRGVPLERVTMTSDANGNMPFHDDEGRLVRVVVQSMQDLIDEIRDLVKESRVPLETALQFVTTNVARLFRLRGKGRLRVGSDGDVLVLSPDLIVHALLGRGRVLVEKGQPAVRGFFE